MSEDLKAILVALAVWPVLYFILVFVMSFEG
jgi:hypothetical protein